MIPNTLLMCLFNDKVDPKKKNGRQKRIANSNSSNSINSYDSINTDERDGSQNGDDGDDGDDDDDSSDDGDDVYEAITSDESNVNKNNYDNESPTIHTPLLKQSGLSNNNINDINNNSRKSKSSLRDHLKRFFCAKNVPLLMFLSDLVGSLGSGMTLRFFPLFLKVE